MDLLELGEEEEDLHVYSKGHRSRLVAPTGTKDSTVPVGATNRDRWPGRGGAWCCHVAPGFSLPVGIPIFKRWVFGPGWCYKPGSLTLLCNVSASRHFQIYF